ncbi:MAG: HD-GYP domain-containing protein, partial [Candidatus Aminicenantes bacterium]|nr:HD-GYP domain-containing protein [Candidatus Aminicenantes bacterium]
MNDIDRTEAVEESLVRLQNEEHLRENVKRLQAELNKKLDQLRKTLYGTVKTIEHLVEARDPHTASHQRRVTHLVCAVAREMGCDEYLISGLQVMASIHDIGKTAIPSDILGKPSALNENEFAIVKTHPAVAYDILKELEFPWPVAEAVFQHHERMDGSGYPRGHAGDRIIMEARLLAVADVVEAMASHRPYRPALGLNRALEEINAQKGKLFDASIVEACVGLV